MVVLEDMPLLKAIYTARQARAGRLVTPSARYACRRRQPFNLSVDFVRHFQEAGLIRRDLDPEAIAYLLIALRYGMLTMDDLYAGVAEAPSVAEVGDTLAEMLSERACAA